MTSAVSPLNLSPLSESADRWSADSSGDSSPGSDGGPGRGSSEQHCGRCGKNQEMYLASAAAAGEYLALRRHLERRGWTPPAGVAERALLEAATNGHAACVMLLLEKCPQISTRICSDAMHESMDNLDVVLVLAGDARGVPSARALEAASRHDDGAVRRAFAYLGAQTADRRRTLAAAGEIEA